MWNGWYQEHSFSRLFVLWNIHSRLVHGIFVPWTVRSLDHSFPWWNFHSRGPFVPWTIHCRDWILGGTFLPCTATIAIQSYLCTNNRPPDWHLRWHHSPQASHSNACWRPVMFDLQMTHTLIVDVFCQWSALKLLLSKPHSLLLNRFKRLALY